MSEVWIALVVAAGTAIVMWIMGWVRTFLAKRIHVESPESKAIAQLTAMVRKSNAVQDAIMDTQIIQSKAMRVLLEAVSGKINGNIEIAIGLIDAADNQFNAFLRSRVRGDLEELDGIKE
jgi:hypothetical protein